jgi:hypothetical protein
MFVVDFSCRYFCPYKVVKYLENMTYMIIEKFHPGKQADIFKRFDEKGRMLPECVVYLNSWINENVTVCYQWMEAPSEEKLLEWIKQWKDLADFEIVKVIDTKEARAKALA